MTEKVGTTSHVQHDSYLPSPLSGPVNEDVVCFVIRVAEYKR
jgi:hypothetical protein